MIIDKYNDPTDFEEMKYRQNLDLTNIDDIKELFDRLEDKRIPDRIGLDIPKRFTNSMNKNSNAINKYISLPDDVKLIDDAKLCLLARNYRGNINYKGGWFNFGNENNCSKFVKEANKYLAGKGTLETEQQDSSDESLKENANGTEHFSSGTHTGTRTKKILFPRFYNLLKLMFT